MKLARLSAVALACLFATIALSLPGQAHVIKKKSELQQNQRASHWTIIVCAARPSSVKLMAGPSKDDVEVFATWHDGDGQRTYALPQRMQHLEDIYFKAEATDKLPVELCVLYDGHPKKRFGFDGGGEDHFVKASDNDDNDCKCQ